MPLALAGEEEGHIFMLAGGEEGHACMLAGGEEGHTSILAERKNTARGRALRKKV